MSIETGEKKKRGFAAMTPEKRKEIAARGGKKAHELGKGHKFAKGEEAQAAGRKGGQLSKKPKTEESPKGETEGED